MTTNPPQTVVSCVIRGQLVAGLPVFAAIDTGGHQPFGVLSVDALTYGVRIWHEPVEFIGDAQVTSDETLADLDIVCGASWALDHVDVLFYRAGAKVTAATTCVPNANVWVHLSGWPPIPA